MEELVGQYMKTKKMLLNSFGCEDDYFVKNSENLKWSISTNDSWCILSYWENIKNKEIKTDVAVVKKNGRPQIFKTEDYTMVVGIQCVKIAFVFDNKKRTC